MFGAIWILLEAMTIYVRVCYSMMGHAMHGELTESKSSAAIIYPSIHLYTYCIYETKSDMHEGECNRICGAIDYISNCFNDLICDWQMRCENLLA